VFLFSSTNSFLTTFLGYKKKYQIIKASEHKIMEALKK
jgi:hypothetical protein